MGNVRIPKEKGEKAIELCELFGKFKFLISHIGETSHRQRECHGIQHKIHELKITSATIARTSCPSSFSPPNIIQPPTTQPKMKTHHRGGETPPRKKLNCSPCQEIFQLQHIPIEIEGPSGKFPFSPCTDPQYPQTIPDLIQIFRNRTQ
ncbi:hypothetical protein TNIN_169621 [Trichonephila inaurata madagascariensis]|uniref:Uncharacterized protein n=1 Tax=Trichonephila inaurata madagascariensis TaxID=2747483 RepID=A0A8X6WXM8_9ARAC|nr:hypothetical protein TNIN_169621 [Trichonephila inaurata madagascariensis]